MTIYLIIAACFVASAAMAADTNSLSAATPLQRAEAIILPEFKLDAVIFPEATKRLHDASKKYDPRHEGFQFIMDFRDKSKARVAAKTKISLDLKHVTLADAAKRVCQQVKGFEIAYPNDSNVIVFQPETNRP